MRLLDSALVAVFLAVSCCEEAILPWDDANVPGPGWPGATEEESNAAWPTGEQPATLVAWPTAESGKPDTCWSVTVLSDTEGGWPGTCRGLNLVAGVLTEEVCETRCREDPACRVWQFNVLNACYHGAGQQCDEPPLEGAAALQRAQMLQHGDVRVMKDMRGWEVRHLKKLGILTGPHGLEDGAEQCRRYCYSNVRCQFWQYGADGCWVEDPLEAIFHSEEYAAQFPLTTTTGASSTSEFAQTVTAGEYIQHICPAKPLPHDEIEEDEPLVSQPVLWDGLALLICGLLGLGGAIYCCGRACALQGGEKKRSLNRSDQSRKRTIQEAEEVRQPLAGMEVLREGSSITSETALELGRIPANSFPSAPSWPPPGTPSPAGGGHQYAPLATQSHAGTPAMSPAGSMSVKAYVASPVASSSPSMVAWSQQGGSAAPRGSSGLASPAPSSFRTVAPGQATSFSAASPGQATSFTVSPVRTAVPRYRS